MVHYLGRTSLSMHSLHEETETTMAEVLISPGLGKVRPSDVRWRGDERRWTSFSWQEDVEEAE